MAGKTNVLKKGRLLIDRGVGPVMSTVVFNPATPKRISAFVLFISDYLGLARTGRTYSALGRSILYTRSLVRASTPHPFAGRWRWFLSIVGRINMIWLVDDYLQEIGTRGVRYPRNYGQPARRCDVYAVTPSDKEWSQVADAKHHQWLVMEKGLMADYWLQERGTRCVLATCAVVNSTGG